MCELAALPAVVHVWSDWTRMHWCSLAISSTIS